MAEKKTVKKVVAAKTIKKTDKVSDKKTVKSADKTKVKKLEEKPLKAKTAAKTETKVAAKKVTEKAKAAVVEKKTAVKAVKTTSIKDEKPVSPAVKKAAKAAAPAEKPAVSAAPAVVKEKHKSVTHNHNIEIKEIEVDEFRIEAAKFYAPQMAGKNGKKVLQKVKPEAMNEGELPDRYFDNKVVLMARDPYWCYAYWDIAPEIMEKAQNDAKAGHGNGILTLRVFDVTDLNFNGENANKSVDITVSGEANNWYINVWEAGRKYIVDLGLKSQDGHFVTIARSNPVATPRDTVSSITEEEWMTVDEDFDEIFRMSGGGTKPASGSERFPISLNEHLSSHNLSSMGSASLQTSEKSETAQAVKKRGFWLVADTELILYGATERDARVRVKGEPVKLEADGSFSLRFHLPDGTMQLPVEAESNDGVDKITLKFTVERQSK